MNQDVGVFDLGNADAAPETAAAQALDETAVGTQRPAAVRSSKPAPRMLSAERFKMFERLAWLRGWPGVTRSLSLVLPGAGQLVRGEITFGLFLLATSAFLWSFAWALLETLDRLAGTLSLLGLSVMVVFWTLCGIYLLAGVLHLTATLSTIDRPGSAGEVAYHPAVTGFASGLIPGWGQLLNGDRFRAGLFLASVWIAAGIWIALSPAATEVVSAYLPGVSSLEQTARRPGPLWIARFTFPAIIWALAVYDAASSSIHRRR